MKQQPASEAAAPLAYREPTAAAMIGMSPRTLKRWRRDGEGPPYAAIGRAIVYPADALQAWLAERTRKP